MRLSKKYPFHCAGTKLFILNLSFYWLPWFIYSILFTTFGGIKSTPYSIFYIVNSGLPCIAVTAVWDEFSTVKMPAWTQKLYPDCISQILRIVCTLSSLEPLSFECELHPLTGTLLEARIKLQRRLLTLLLPAEPSSTSWQSLPPVKAQKCVLVKNNVLL